MKYGVHFDETHERFYSADELVADLALERIVLKGLQAVASDDVDATDAGRYGHKEEEFKRATQIVTKECACESYVVRMLLEGLKESWDDNAMPAEIRICRMYIHSRPACAGSSVRIIPTPQ